MKKKKLRILLNIITLCLCITAIAIGVYSAKQAKLNVSGTVGFNAHNCHIKITPSVTGYKADGTKQTNAEQDIIELGKTSTDTTGNMELQELNFNDLNADGNVITILLKIENLSAFDVKATISTPTIKNGSTIIEETIIKKEVKNGEIILEDNAGVKIGKATSDSETNNIITITITLTALDLSNTSQDVLNNSSFSMKIDFSKYVPPQQAYLASNWKSLVFTGVVDNDSGDSNAAGNSDGFCTNDDISKLVFTNIEPTGTNLVNNAGVAKSISIGSNNIDEKRVLGEELTNAEITDINAYAKLVDGKYEIYLYSPGTIYICSKADEKWDDVYDQEYPTALQFSSLKMTTIDWGNADFSLVTDISGMFYKCNNLISIDFTEITTIDFSKLTNLSNLFYNCKSITSINMTNFDTSNVTSMSEMFSGCNNLLSLDLTNFNTSRTEDMGYMFGVCLSLTELDLSNFDTRNVTKIYSMFVGCKQLKSLNLSSFKTSKATNFSEMFAGCVSLTKLDLSNFDTSSVSNTQVMFQRCTNLKTIYVSDKWTMNKVTNDYGMFEDCTNLVGGAGTKFDSTKTDKTYACIDGSTDANGNTLKGYLTLKP